jgi:hypothetical protein
MAKTLNPALTPFYPLPTTVANIPSKKLNTTAKLVFAVIAGTSNLEKGKCWLSHKGIGEKIGLSASAVRDTMKALERLNLIIVEPKNGSSNRITPNYKELERLKNISNSGATDISTPTDDSHPVQKDTKPDSVGGGDGIPVGGATEYSTRIEERIEESRNPLSPLLKGEHIFYPFENDPGYYVDAKKSDESTRRHSKYPNDNRASKNPIWLSLPGFPQFLKDAFPRILFDGLNVIKIRKSFSAEQINTSKLARAIIANPKLREIGNLAELIDTLCSKYNEKDDHGNEKDDHGNETSYFGDLVGTWKGNQEDLEDKIKLFYSECPKHTLIPVGKILTTLRGLEGTEERKVCHRSILSTIGTKYPGYSADFDLMQRLGEKFSTRFTNTVVTTFGEPFNFYYGSTQLGMTPTDCSKENRENFVTSFVLNGFIRDILMLYTNAEAEQFFAVDRDRMIKKVRQKQDHFEMEARRYQIDIESLVGSEAIIEMQSICDDTKAETPETTD